MSDQIDPVKIAEFETKALSVLQQMVEEQKDHRDTIMDGIERLSLSVGKIGDVVYAFVRAILGVGMIAGATTALWFGKIGEDKWLWACVFAVSPEIIEKILNKKLSIAESTAKLIAFLALAACLFGYFSLVGPSVM